MMNNTWIALQSIPSGGGTLLYEDSGDDQGHWQALIREFGLECRIVEPLRVEIFVLPQGDGVLFRGRLTGRVALPCDRCASDSIVAVNHAFDSFEAYPVETPLKPGEASRSEKSGRRNKHQGKRQEKHQGKHQAKREEPENPDAAMFDAALFDAVDDAVIRNAAHGGGIEINPVALAWEEFSLALPIKPLCSNECKGLCPECGSDRNTEPCSCVTKKGDPRLAALRGLMVNRSDKE